MGKFSNQECIDIVNNIINAKSAMRSIIIYKGVPIPEDTPFSDYPAKTALIPAPKPEETASRTYTTNGAYVIKPQDEEHVLTEATVTVDVDTIKEKFGELTSSSKVFYYDGDDGADYSDIISHLPSGWTAKALHNLIVNVDPEEATVNLTVE